MHEQELIPHLFRTEYRKIISVLVKLFGIEHIEIAEDIVSDTFLQAAETWGQKGLPQNPTAWLYTVSKNKTKDLLKHNAIFNKKIAVEIKHTQASFEEIEIDLSNKNINDSQLQMIFAICHPCITTESQIGLALNILCGFGAEEIADAFLSNRESIYKRLQRAKEKLKTEKINIELPIESEINNRLETVLTTMYLLFNEGYYSESQNVTLRKDLCLEAMRLTLLLSENEGTNIPQVNALLSLMCFHASRFEARLNQNGEIILYEDQDEKLWSRELIEKGEYYLNKASSGNKLSKYHLEAAIAFWHTNKTDTKEKWENILQLYNKLLVLEYSPVAALNRTYGLSKANSSEEAIIEAEKLGLKENHLYHSLLAELYKTIDTVKALEHLKTALKFSKTTSDKILLRKKIKLIEEKKK
ncbi:MAG: RNA polymerase subunit sigma [Bacteroidetes bacterium]|nr:RNA polymerase subunit sigma [Bacteroidota bacterium]